MASTNPLDNFFLKFEEPTSSCMLALRQIIMASHPQVEEKYKYGLPFYYIGKIRYCYIWKDKRNQHPYLGFPSGKLLNHPSLVQGNRKSMKVFPINPYKDIPIKGLQAVFEEIFALYKI